MKRQFVCDICGHAFPTEEACLAHERECGAKVKCVRVSLTDKDSEAKFAFDIQLYSSCEKGKLGIVNVHPCGLGFLMDVYVCDTQVRQAVDALSRQADKTILERDQRLMKLRESRVDAKEEVLSVIEVDEMRRSE